MIDTLRERLLPLTDWIPPDILGVVRVEVWWLIELVIVLAVLLLIGRVVRASVRALSRALFHRPIAWDVDLQAPLRTGPGDEAPILHLYQRPGWLRLIILAPMGKRPIDPADGPLLLRHLGPNLETPAASDQPAIRLWPRQLSTMGFTNTFHRLTPTGEAEGDPTHWVFLAGRATVGKMQLFLGLGLWMREPCSLGRLNLEPQQWRDALRLLDAGGGDHAQS